MIIHFHRSVHVRNREIQALPSSVVYLILPYSVQEDEGKYSEAQRYIFQANGIIPLEIWPDFAGSWNYLLLIPIGGQSEEHKENI